VSYVGEGQNVGDILIWNGSDWVTGPNAGGSGISEVQAFSVGTASDLNIHTGGSNGTAAATLVIPSAPLTLTSLKCNHGSGTTGGNVQMGIYNSALNGGNLLVASSIVALVSGLNTHAIASTPLSGDTPYFFAVWNDNNQPLFASTRATVSSNVYRRKSAAGLLSLPGNISGIPNATMDGPWVLGD
jgi:hypothetical protein